MPITFWEASRVESYWTGCEVTERNGGFTVSGFHPPGFVLDGRLGACRSILACKEYGRASAVTGKTDVSRLISSSNAHYGKDAKTENQAGIRSTSRLLHYTSRHRAIGQCLPLLGSGARLRSLLCRTGRPMLCCLLSSAYVNCRGRPRRLSSARVQDGGQ